MVANPFRIAKPGVLRVDRREFIVVLLSALAVSLDAY
jgi:hypothetical protein